MQGSFDSILVLYSQLLLIEVSDGLEHQLRHFLLSLGFDTVVLSRLCLGLLRDRLEDLVQAFLPLFILLEVRDGIQLDLRLRDLRLVLLNSDPRDSL